MPPAPPRKRGIRGRPRPPPRPRPRPPSSLPSSAPLAAAAGCCSLLLLLLFPGAAAFLPSPRPGGGGGGGGPSTSSPTFAFLERGGRFDGDGEWDGEWDGDEAPAPAPAPAGGRKDHRPPGPVLRWNLARLCRLGPDEAGPLLAPLLRAGGDADGEYGECGEYGHEGGDGDGGDGASSPPPVPSGPPPPGTLPPQVEPYRRFVSGYDRDLGHDGRFTVFGAGGGAGGTTLHPAVVLSHDRPLAFLRDALSCEGDPDYPPPEEAVVFLPGPNTPHEGEGGGEGGGERRMRCVRAAGGVGELERFTWRGGTAGTSDRTDAPGSLGQLVSMGREG